MYITVDDIEKEISLYYPIDNRNANKKVRLIRAYLHLRNGEPLKVKRGCYTMKDIEKVSSSKVKYDSLTGKSVIDPTISRFRPYMNKILGISNGNYLGTLLSKKRFHLKLTNCQQWITYSMANHVTYVYWLPQ